jgi:hypothetical protein
VWATLPWPQATTLAEVRAVAAAGVALRDLRRSLLERDRTGLRALYRALDVPGKHPLAEAHRALDEAVRAAYGLTAAGDPLRFLLDLNRALAAREAKGERVIGPGLPPSAGGRSSLVSKDCVGR